MHNYYFVGLSGAPFTGTIRAKLLNLIDNLQPCDLTPIENDNCSLSSTNPNLCCCAAKIHDLVSTLDHEGTSYSDRDK